MRYSRRLIAKALIILCLAALIAVPVQAASQQTEYWASAKSDKYHYPTCQWAQKIKAENLIVFKSKADAQQNGYVACKVCKP